MLVTACYGTAEVFPHALGLGVGPAAGKVTHIRPRHPPLVDCFRSRAERSRLSLCQVRNYSPGYMEQTPSRGHKASPQSGLVVGCELYIYSCSEKLRGLSVRAQAQRISISLSFSVVGVFPFLPPPRSAMRRGPLAS